jgi:small conductance mechanosensitive channel
MRHAVTKMKRTSDTEKKRMFETRSHSWREAGLARQLSRSAIRRARLQVLLFAPLLGGIFFLYDNRQRIFGVDTPVRAATVIALLMLGWAMARDLGRLAGPTLFRRMDPATAGTVGFLTRLAGMIVVLLVALRIAGIRPQTLAVGGAFSAIVAGLAAQQTLGNLFAGMVLLSARPFRVGERIKLQGMGIDNEGVVSALGLLYTNLDDGDNTVMVPNSTVLNVAVMPLREPDGVDLRARLPADATPRDLEELLRSHIETPLRGRPSVRLEELIADEIVVRITAVPASAQDGPHLASEVLEVVARESARLASDGTPRFSLSGVGDGDGHADEEPADPFRAPTERAPDGRPRRPV